MWHPKHKLVVVETCHKVDLCCVASSLWEALRVSIIDLPLPVKRSAIQSCFTFGVILGSQQVGIRLEFGKFLHQRHLQNTMCFSNCGSLWLMQLELDYMMYLIFDISKVLRVNYQLVLVYSDLTKVELTWRILARQKCQLRPFCVLVWNDQSSRLCATYKWECNRKSDAPVQLFGKIMVGSKHSPVNPNSKTTF